MTTLAEVLPSIQQLPASDKIKLIRLLAEDLDSTEDIAPFEPGKTYYLATPYNSYGAAEVLLTELDKFESQPQ
jgi:hypothetical protein